MLTRSQTTIAFRVRIFYSHRSGETAASRGERSAQPLATVCYCDEWRLAPVPGLPGLPGLPLPTAGDRGVGEGAELRDAGATRLRGYATASGTSSQVLPAGVHDSSTTRPRHPRPVPGLLARRCAQRAAGLLELSSACSGSACA